MRIFKGLKLKVNQNAKQKGKILFNDEMRKYEFVISNSYKFPITYDGWHWYEWMLNTNEICLDVI